MARGIQTHTLIEIVSSRIKCRTRNLFFSFIFTKSIKWVQLFTQCVRWGTWQDEVHLHNWKYKGTDVYKVAARIEFFMLFLLLAFSRRKQELIF